MQNNFLFYFFIYFSLIGCEKDPSNEAPDLVENSNLITGQLTWTQTWSQQPNGFPRTAQIRVPTNNNPKHPVLMVLHGNGDTASRFLSSFQRVENYILIAPQGYEKSWNILRELSKAPDVDFIRTILSTLSSYDNVDTTNITIYGSSNGSALLNQLLIELDENSFQKAISLVSPLNGLQYHDGSFYMQGNDLNYTTSKIPSYRQQILTFSGTNDDLIPYQGGNGVLGYEFLNAQDSAYLWASAMGYSGQQKVDTDGIEVKNSIFKYEYPQVIHFKVFGGDHGLNPHRNAVEELVLAFLNP